MRQRLRLAALLAAVAAFSLAALFHSLPTLDGDVESVIDGDDLIVAGARVRLLPFDSDDFHDPGGPQAKAFMESLVSRRTIHCRILWHDERRRYGFCAMSGAGNVSCLAARAGHAGIWARRIAAPFCSSGRRLT